MDRGLLIDPEKQSAVLNWPRLVGLRAIHHFLGYANYYRQFILHFSTLRAPISALTKKGNNPKILTPEAHLKAAFASTTILHRPDSDKPFFLEVDASSIRADTVLSLKNSKGKTCGFFSKSFSPAERNYTVGDQELLAIKLALEEWQHLLVGARHLATIFTNHQKPHVSTEGSATESPPGSLVSFIFSL